MILMVRLAEKVIELYENPDKFEEWLKLMSKANVIKYKRSGNIFSLEGRITTGVSPSFDPLTNLVCLGFAFFGELWVYMPDVEQAFDKVKKWWKEKIKEKKKIKAESEEQSKQQKFRQLSLSDCLS